MAGRETEDVETTFFTVLRRIPSLRGVGSFQATRIPSMTNPNYVVTAGGRRLVVRLPGDGTEEFIDRRAEWAATRLAAEADVGAPLEFFDPVDGLMVTAFVEASTMDALRFTDDLGAVARAGSVLRQLHDSDQLFPADLRPFSLVEEYVSLLASKDAELPDGFDDVRAMAESARAVFEQHPVEQAPCHGDPLCENFLDTGERMYLVDYEYAGNCDPMWDLGGLAADADLTNEQQHVLLRAYFHGEEIPHDAAARVVVYRALSDLLWTLRGMIQHVNNNRTGGFLDYATTRFERCQDLVRSQAFQRSIEIVAAQGATS